MSSDRIAPWKIEREKKAYRRELEADGRLRSTIYTRNAQMHAYLDMFHDGEIDEDGRKLG